MLEVVDITHVRVVVCAICPTHARRPCQMSHCQLHESPHFLPSFMPRPLMRISPRPVKFSFIGRGGCSLTTTSEYESERIRYSALQPQLHSHPATGVHTTSISSSAAIPWANLLTPHSNRRINSEKFINKFLHGPKRLCLEIIVTFSWHETPCRIVGITSCRHIAYFSTNHCFGNND
jgi:hypothetical protein